MTDAEKRQLASERRSATYAKRRKREQARRIEMEARWNDYPAGLEVCRRIRDDESRTAADRLYAIALIETLKTNSNQY